jgi:hypothetical protein
MDTQQAFFLSLWLAGFGHEEDILEHLDTVQVSQNPFFESNYFGNRYLCFEFTMDCLV